MILSPSPWWSMVSTGGAVLGYALLARHPLAWRSTTLNPWVWCLHGLALWVGQSGPGWHFGFAPALSATAWLVFGLYLIESRIYPQLPVNRSLVALSAATLLLAWWWPGPLYPSVSSAWVPLHGFLGLVSYGLLAGAVLHGWLAQRAEAALRQTHRRPPGLPLLALERLTFQLVGAAFLLLSATGCLGAWLHGWALERGFWTHKTVFTLLSWLVLSVLLWGRHTQGWRGRLAIRMLYTAAALLLLGYVGSRFVLEVVLARS